MKILAFPISSYYNSLMILVIFGLPGAGKSYLGNLLQKTFGFFHYDGDDALPVNMKKMLIKGEKITDRQRSIFFNKLTQQVKRIATRKKNIVISQTFIKEKYRYRFLKAMPYAKFILVQTKNDVREKRLLQRNDLDLDYVKNMVKLFEKPAIKHFKIENNIDGKMQVIKNLEDFLHNQKINN